ncbi:YqiA/YcfP family alpha/beta fold hydrolase [Chlorogloea sp. CCALA 695]|uniref:YqiA/YcfP family alpha/beta fold hydrolase n=1 Tax=Chlorogloea sp. CCALA 695 TaxID=2107693 RepID=UPI000D07E8A3|nr:YqiA/YcfP family alpha/beta fold hydrolase [Chlorogloea sp. CCALA 695]PSB30736.1 esterase [Chlorogloea sp. CCALA 695]
MDYIYLHGFASSPNSAKAQYFRSAFAELAIDLKIPDLNQGNFSKLTIKRQIEQVLAQFPPSPTPVTLIGSSLGGLTAALIAEKSLQVQRLVLLAPALEFLSHWLPQIGEAKLKQWQAEQQLMVYHYAEKRSLPLNYNFVIDAANYQDKLLLRPVSTLILHGCHDEVIPITASRNFASSRPWVQLIELNSNHALADVITQWQQIKSFIIP